MADIPVLRKRDSQAHKGDFGHLLLVGGSTGMAGAIALAGMAAMRSGAGRVTIATPMAVAPIVASFDPCLMVVPCPSDSDGRFQASALGILRAKIKQTDCVALGPGMGQSDELAEIVATLYRECPTPAVLDADALNLLGRIPVLQHLPAGPRVLTPHPGEFRRLANDPQLTPEECRLRAPVVSQRYSATIVCKGAKSLVVDPDRQHQNETGNPGMATAGAGDVLTGIIAALIGQRYSIWDAAVLGVHAHGLAGDLGAQSLGETSLTARDIIDYLPQAWSVLATK